MQEKDDIKLLYTYEQNLLKSCTETLLESSSEIIHDNILNIFDNVYEINIRIYKYLLKEQLIKKERTTKRKKEILYEELDSLLLRINE